MNARRLLIDPFAFALGALALLTYAFYADRNGAAVLMCALALAGVLAARLAGFSNRALVPLAAGLVVLLWVLWVNPPPLSTRSDQRAGARHGRAFRWLGGLGVPAGPSRVADVGGRRGRRRPRPLRPLGARLLGDRALGTALVPSERDSVLDIAFGTLGGTTGTFLATLLPARRRALAWPGWALNKAAQQRRGSATPHSRIA